MVWTGSAVALIISAPTTIHVMDAIEPTRGLVRFQSATPGSDGHDCTMFLERAHEDASFSENARDLAPRRTGAPVTMDTRSAGRQLRLASTTSVAVERRP